MTQTHSFDLSTGFDAFIAYTKECERRGMGVVSLNAVMTDTAAAADKIALDVRQGRLALTVARLRMVQLVEKMAKLTRAIKKNDGWLSVFLDVKGRDVITFSGRLEVAAIKIRLMSKGVK